MDSVLVLPACTSFREHKIDFSFYLGGCIDEFVTAALSTLRVELTDGDRSIATVLTISTTARAVLFPWLVTASSAMGRSLFLDDIDKSLLESFAADLRLDNSYSTASCKCASVLMLIESMSRLGYLAPFSGIRPHAQFPGRNAATISTRPYSKLERDALIRALASDFRNIRDELHPDIAPGSTDALAVGLLLLALPTGLNLTPLLELGRDALRPHPLHMNEWMLVAYKRRSNREQIARVKWSDEISAMRSLDLHLVVVYQQIATWTQARTLEVDEQHRHLVFIRPPLEGKTSTSEKPVPMTLGDFGYAVGKLNKRYAITADDGRRLTISMRRIRATLAARIYDLSGGDPFVVARVLGNLPRTTALHYLEPEFGAPAKFARAVQEFAANLQQSPSQESEPTPVGGCSDPLHGRFAPKDGITYCQRWLHCFQCPNQCITGDENGLWRLYSFYWLLHEKSQALKRLQISGQVRFALHVIDTVVLERFGASAQKAKDAARVRPHPIWAGVKASNLFFKEVADD